MATGTIKWFNNTKGWGFISPDEGKEEIFIHFSAVLNDNKSYKTLFTGQRISYTIKTRENGIYAVDASLIVDK